MTWPFEIRTLENGWKMRNGKLVSPFFDEYGPDDALTPDDVSDLRGVRLRTVREEISKGKIPSFGRKHILVYARDAVMGYQTESAKLMEGK